MPAPVKTQKFVKEELPYKILMSIYEDSRASLRKIGRDLNISYHTVQETLKDLEAKYGIAYTLNIDEHKLGFSQGELVTIKFGVKPSIDFLKEKLNKEVFIQNAYLAEGDFDLLLHVVGIAPEDFQTWQWQFRISLSEYKPIFRLSIIGEEYTIGFLPIRNEIIKEGTALSDPEKRVLMLLNENSRMKMQEIRKRSKLSQNKVAYIMKKFVSEGTIRKFTALTQNPDKKTFAAFLGKEAVPTKNHMTIVLAFAEALISENLKEVVNDYGLILGTHGHYDSISICAFKDGENLARRGSQLLLETILKEEETKMEKAILTYCIVGKWPFHLEEYKFYRELLPTSQ